MQTNRYLIAILPPEPITSEVLELKEHFRDKYQSKASLNAPAHITMHMPFEWSADRETELVKIFTEVSAMQVPIPIELDGFGCFPPRVIFITVVTNPLLDDTRKHLLQFCKTRLNLTNVVYRDEPFHPHVTLAFRDLKESFFEAAWEEFRSRPYKAIFECTQLSLLKHDGKSWREFS